MFGLLLYHVLPNQQPRPRILLVNFNLEGKPLAILILINCNTFFVNSLDDMKFQEFQTNLFLLD